MTHSFVSFAFQNVEKMDPLCLLKMGKSPMLSIWSTKQKAPPRDTYMADACWCMAKPIQYYKVKIIIIIN